MQKTYDNCAHLKGNVYAANTGKHYMRSSTKWLQLPLVYLLQRLHANTTSETARTLYGVHATKTSFLEM